MSSASSRETALRRCPIRLQLPTQYFNAFNFACGKVVRFPFCFATYGRAIVAFRMTSTVVRPVGPLGQNMIELLIIDDAKSIEDHMFKRLTLSLNECLQVR